MQALRATAWIWMPPSVAGLLFVAIGLSGSNSAIFLELNHFGHMIGSFWWDNLTIMGDAAIALALVLPMIRRSPRCFWGALIAALIIGLSVQIFKRVVPMPRPLAALSEQAFFHSGPQLRAGSFPSGHAATIFALAGIVIMHLSRHALVRWALLSLAILVAMSRIMVGVHWPLDVLAGMMGGWGAAYAGVQLSDRLAWKTGNPGGILAGVVLMGIATALLVSAHTGFHAALVFQRLIGCLCLVLGIHEMYQLLPLQHLAARWHNAGKSIVSHKRGQ